MFTLYSIDEAFLVLVSSFKTIGIQLNVVYRHVQTSEQKDITDKSDGLRDHFTLLTMDFLKNI